MTMIGPTKLMQIPFLDTWWMLFSRQVPHERVMGHLGHDPSQNLIKISQVATIHKMIILKILTILHGLGEIALQS